MTRFLWVSAICAASPVALVLGMIALRDSGPLAPVPPTAGTLHTVGKAVATLEGPVRLARQARVLAVHVRPGQPVRAGDAIAEMEDLALLRSIGALERQIGEMEERHEDRAETPPAEALQAEMDLRASVVRQLERDLSRATEELARWTEMKEEGLVARLDYERKRSEFEDLEARLENARRQAAHPPAPAAAVARPPQSRRSLRLLERLKGLPSSYPLTSPWDGTVGSVLVEPGEVPVRGKTVATILRTALARLEAEVAPGTGVLEVRSACGLPGPLPFSLRAGKLSVVRPDPRVRLGDTCPVVLSVRE